MLEVWGVLVSCVTEINYRRNAKKVASNRQIYETCSKIYRDLKRSNLPADQRLFRPPGRGKGRPRSHEKWCSSCVTNSHPRTTLLSELSYTLQALQIDIQLPMSNFCKERRLLDACDRRKERACLWLSRKMGHLAGDLLFISCISCSLCLVVFRLFFCSHFKTLIPSTFAIF